MPVIATKIDAKSAAREWVAILNSGEATAADHAEFEAWRNADAAHVTAFEQVSVLWRDVAAMQDLKAMVPPDVRKVREPSPSAIAHISAILARSAIPAALAASIVFIFTFVVWQPIEWGSPAKPSNLYATQIAEIRDVTLADGSVVTLDARSKIDVQFTAAERRVTLEEGTAFFSVEKDADRPFYVSAGDTIIRVIGTKFDVRRGVDEVRVSVVEGVVEVARPEATEAGAILDDATKQTLTAGQQAIAHRNGDVASVQEVQASEPAAWRQGRLVYNDVSLREVIADANRYFDGEIMIASSDLGDLGVTAAFNSDQIDQLIDSLEVVLNLEAVRRPAGRVLLRAKPDNS